MGESSGIVRWLDNRFYPKKQYKDEEQLFREFIECYLTPESCVLDAGCGDGTLFQYNFKERIRYLVGVDISNTVGRNQNVHHGVRADLRLLPFQSGSFDLILSRYVLEHLPVPSEVFCEFARLLKQGGVLAIHTPNIFHYVPLVSRVTPYSFHRVITRMRGLSESDTFPTFYRANTRRKLIRLGKEAGLQPIEILTYESRPNYLAFWAPVFLAGTLYERLVNRFDLLSLFRVNLICAFQKR